MLVIGQSPKAGSKVTLGTEIGIAVSLGKGVGAITVPKVVGKKEADAVAAMNSAGLKPTVYRQYSDTVAKGIVSEQLPTGGTTAAAGSQVAIAVSLGKAPVSSNLTVPNVVGKTQADATAALESAGFVAQAISQEDSATAGTVLAQLPVSGSTAPAGSTVAIAIAAPATP